MVLEPMVAWREVLMAVAMAVAGAATAVAGAAAAAAAVAKTYCCTGINSGRIRLVGHNDK